MVSDLIKGMNRIDIRQFKADIAFRSLMEGVDENLYVIPKYQRKFRWTNDQAICLIESLIYGLPIPPIYTFRNKNNQLEILDGQQRILSLFFYYIGKYPKREKNGTVDLSDLALKGRTLRQALALQYVLEPFHIDLEDPKSKQVNVDYANLSLELKRVIDYRAITVIEIQISEDAYSVPVIRKIFANLNAGGTILSRQELRNGIYLCPFYEMLWDINKHNRLWRMIWGKNNNAEAQDMAFLLRLCTLKRYVRCKKISDSDFEFHIAIEDSEKTQFFMTLENHMDEFSVESCNFEEYQVAEYENNLLSFLKLFEGHVPYMHTDIIESFYVVYEKLNIRKPITFADCEIIRKDNTYIHYNRDLKSIYSMKGKWKRVYEIWTGGDTANC